MSTRTVLKFDIRTYNQYRKQAHVIGKHLRRFKNDDGVIDMDKETLAFYIGQITAILKECSNYLDKCGLTMPPPLWKYDVEDPKTQPSSVAFAYKDRMTKKAIKAFGKDFMSKPLKPKKEEVIAA